MAVHQPLSVVNLCRACGEDFAGLSAFDRHRVGTHGYRWSPDREDGRRCLIGDELLEAGMELDSKGRWRIVLTDEKRSELLSLSAPGSKTVGAGRAQSA
jgi:hypothetical protein